MSGLHIALRLVRPGGFSLEVDLDLPAHGTTALFGPSGSGKTTVLRCVAGLERAAHARVSLGGDVWDDSAQGLHRPTWQRPLGYVFQEASLFDHLTVAKNLVYGQRRAAPAPGDRHGLSLDACIELLGIGHLLERRPPALSGGERQRVAIARALATRPGLLLMDEPLAAIDAARKQEILPWLERLQGELHIPMLYVTHSADEMARLADTVVVLDQGRAVASGPLGPTLARLDVPLLLGDDAATVLEGEIAERDARWHLARVAFPGGSLWVRDAGPDVGRRVRVRVLARDVSVATHAAPGSSIQNAVACTVRAIAAGRHPSQAMLQLDAGGSPLLARITARAVHELRLAPGAAVWAQVKSAALVE
jgi:molybdate transport system ATP-binding protein